MNNIIPDETFNIAGRGTVFVLHNYYVSDFKLNDIIIVEGIRYQIIGLEGRTDGLSALKGVGLNVKLYN